MPASVRIHASRATSSRPYDRRSPTASPTQSGHQGIPPASPISFAGQIQDTNADADADTDTDIPPDHPGLPTYAEYKHIEANYLHSLSPRKRDKALITQAMFDNIWDVLHQPDACTVETPQFRFWVRKMFTLSRPERDGELLGWADGRAGEGRSPAHPLGDDDLELERSMGIGIRERSDADAADEAGFTAVVLHENRPVAIMEQLYELFCYCHVRAGHGGRDKTCAVIREHYSWVPKELTAQFVKACPTCALKRSGGVGLDVGSGMAHRKTIGRGRKGRGATPLRVGIEEASLAWPTTGGPLDLVYPEPYGVRRREPEWLRARGDVPGTVGMAGPAGLSPACDSRTWKEGSLENCPTVGGWNRLDASPFCSAAGHPFAMQSNQEKKNRGPTKTSLPSLATALSDESLDEHVSLASRRGPGGDAAVPADSECVLPPALRPLRLLGPIASATSDLGSEFAAAPSSESLSPYPPFQIDPALLSIDYRRPTCKTEAGDDDDVAIPSDLDNTTASGPLSTTSGARARGRGTTVLPIQLHHFYRPTCASSDARTSIPALDPDSSFERAASASYTAGEGATLSLESPLGRCGGTRYTGPYGYRDGPLATLYHSADMDAPLSFSIIMTDARCI